MNERLYLLQKAVDEVYDHPKEYEELIVNLLITHFKGHTDKELMRWVDIHTISLQGVGI